jgi:hypothetical protein
MWQPEVMAGVVVLGTLPLPEEQMKRMLAEPVDSDSDSEPVAPLEGQRSNNIDKIT